MNASFHYIKNCFLLLMFLSLNWVCLLFTRPYCPLFFFFFLHQPCTSFPRPLFSVVYLFIFCLCLRCISCKQDSVFTPIQECVFNKPTQLAFLWDLSCGFILSIFLCYIYLLVPLSCSLVFAGVFVVVVSKEYGYSIFCNFLPL